MKAARATNQEAAPLQVGIVESGLTASTPAERLFADLYDDVYDAAIAMAIAEFRVGIDVAADAVNQVALEMWRKAPYAQPGQINAQAFMAGVRFRVSDYKRDSARFVELTPTVEQELSRRDELPQISSGAPSERDRAIDIVSAAIGAMPPRRQQVFLLARERGMTAREIAQHLGISAKTVPVHMRLATADVAKALDRAGYRISSASAMQMLPSGQQERAND